LGELVAAQSHLEQAIAYYDPQQHRSHALQYGQDPAVVCYTYVAFTQWLLGSASQALRSSDEAIALAHSLAHAHSLVFALAFTAVLYQYRGEAARTHEHAEEILVLATDYGFAMFTAMGALLRSWAVAAQGRLQDGIAQMRQGLAAWGATGAALWQPYWLTLLAEICGKTGQVKEGLRLLAEAMATSKKTGEQWYEAELYRLKGELTLEQWKVESQKAKGKNQQQKEARGGRQEVSHPHQSLRLEPQVSREMLQEVEECFLKAIEIARTQQAKSLELRAVMSLARLWQRQGKQHEARNMLSEIYGCFTEGFGTKDLQDAKALLDEL